MTERIDIPQHWQIVVSSKILDIRDGTHDTPKYVKENGVPLITSKNLKENQIDFHKVSFISYEDHIEISKRSKVDEGDILFAMIGTIGNPAIIKGNTNFSIKNVGLFKRNEKVILSSFLVNFLGSRTFEKQLSERKLLKGTTQRFIPLGNLRAINIPLPPINEQQQIVSKIEELFSELDKGIEELKTAQQQLKVYRQAVLKWAFEGKLTNEDVKEGELPDSWTNVTIGDVFDVFVGSTPSRKKISYWNGNINWISSGEVAFKSITTTKEKISDEGLENSSCKIHPPGTVIMAMIGEGKTRGQAAILKVHASHNQNTAAIRIPDCYKSELLYYFLVLKYEENRKIGSGNNQKALNKERVKNIPIPLIPVEEQQQIVQEIESRLSVCDKIEETITNSLKQSEALRQSILKKAFEGKLVP